MSLDAARLHDELLENMPAGARHVRDTCPFCMDQASRAPASVPSDSGESSDAIRQELTTQEGGTTHMSDTVTKETHEALLDKAVRTATSSLEEKVAAQDKELGDLRSENSELKIKNQELEQDNTRLNSELDTAQIGLKTAKEENASLQETIAQDKAAREKADVASKRADQVRTLGLFEDKYVADKAASWADMSEEDWSARVEEWRLLKPASTEGDGESEGNGTDASSMTGSSGTLTETSGQNQTKQPSARRSVLGLPD